MPDMGVMKRNVSWTKTKKAEEKAILDFFAQLVDPIESLCNGVICPDKFNKYRNKSFAKYINDGKLKSIGKSRIRVKKWLIDLGTCEYIEDAREAIIIGRLLGYREGDIAFYLVRNYEVDNLIKKYVNQED